MNIKQELFNKEQCDVYLCASVSIVMVVTIVAGRPCMANLAVMAPVDLGKDFWKRGTRRVDSATLNCTILLAKRIIRIRQNWFGIYLRQQARQGSKDM
jgi:hypothetical protein